MRKPMDLAEPAPDLPDGAKNESKPLPPPPPALVEELRKIHAEAEQRITQLQHAAEAWGIRPGSPEKLYLDSQIARDRSMASLVLKFGQAAEEAVVAAQEARYAVQLRVSSLKAESQKLGEETIQKYAEQLGKECIKWNIIRERGWNFNQNWIRVGILTAVVLVLIGVGWVARFEVDKPQVFGAQDCLDAPLMVTNSNGSFLGCPLSDLEPPAVMDQMNHEYFHSGQ
jgi:hypothetical protein